MSASILVLEDDANLRETVVETLEDHGFLVQGAAQADTAVKLARQFDLDLVIADVRMAGRDGIEALEEIRSFRPSVRAIVVTGYADEFAQARAVRLLVDDYVYKPVRLKDLLNLVWRVLDSSQERRRYQRFFSDLLQGSRRFLEQAGFEFKETRLVRMEEVGHEIYQRYFIAVRSRHVNKPRALELYDRIEEVERARRLLQPSHDLEAHQKVLDGMLYARDLVEASSREAPAAIGRAREPDRVSSQEFTHLFDGLTGGAVSAEQWRLAPRVRQIPRADLLASPELRRLRQHLWGPFPAGVQS